MERLPGFVAHFPSLVMNMGLPMVGGQLAPTGPSVHLPVVVLTVKSSGQVGGPSAHLSVVGFKLGALSGHTGVASHLFVCGL